MSTAVALFQGDDAIIGYNFLTKSEFHCDADTVCAMQMLKDWTPRNQVLDLFEQAGFQSPDQMIDCMFDCHCVIEQGSNQHLLEVDFFEKWKWSLPSAIFHLAVTDRAYRDSEFIQDFQQEKIKVTPQPELFERNSTSVNTIQLMKPNLNEGVMTTMCKRRTQRECEPGSITIDTLGDLLFAGLGITGWTENCVGRLPLKMAPSGGARNPYEAYVFVRDVKGLEKGFYHYSAVQHSIEPVVGKSVQHPSSLMADQPWVDNSACLIFLCANFDRSMWKYESDDNAYRVVLIEAGHIAQNIMLVATQNQLSACPSAAVSHGLVHECLGFKSPTQSAIYGMAINNLVKENFH